MPPEDPRTTRFAICAPAIPGADTKIVIDGVDVTDKTRAFEVAGSVDATTQVLIWPHVGAGTIEGDAVVSVVDPDLAAPDSAVVLAAVAERVRGLDPAEVREAAMRIHGLDNRPIPDAYVAAVADAIEAPG